MATTIPSMQALVRITSSLVRLGKRRGIRAVWGLRFEVVQEFPKPSNIIKINIEFLQAEGVGQQILGARNGEHWYV